MKIEMLKPHKLLVVGQVLDIDIEYSANLIKRGLAKSLEATKESEPKKS